MQSAPSQRALLLSLGLATFMVSLDGRVVAPLLPTIAADFSTSVAHAGWLVSAYMLPYGFCQLAYGPLADRFGKVRVATHAMVWFSVGTALCGAFPSFAMIVLLRALTGAAAAALIPLTIAYIGDTVAYEKRQAALAMLMASAGAAQAFSTSAGGTIAAFVSWRTVFPILGALAALSTVLLFVYRGRELRLPVALDAPPQRYREVLRAPRMRTLLLLVSFEGALYIGGFPFLSGLLEQRFKLDSFAIGLVLGVAGVAQLVFAYVLPWILRRLSEQQLMLVGGSAMGVAYLLSAYGSRWQAVVCSCALAGAGFAMCHSTLQTRATEAFPHGRGRSLALFAFSLFSGSALGTVCIGYASDAYGYEATFLAVGLLLLLFTALAVRLLGPRELATSAVTAQ
ncbi:MAG: putative arabinose efflux permease, family [Myxococcaceae bacterium]|nr:putative arabinose efflux permease, family [Myxococcaceae bacterium]